MKRTNKNLLKIVAATSVCIFSLFSLFAGSTAWFLSVQNVDNGVDGMKVKEALRQFKKISIHRFVSSTIVDGNTTYYFDQAVAASLTVDQIISGTGTLTFAMDKYSLLRRTNPTLALIELSDTYTASAADPVSLTLSTETTAFLTSYTAAEVAAMTTRPLSNVVKANAGYLTVEGESGDDTTSIDDISQTGEMTYAIDGTTKSDSQYVFSAPSSYSQFVSFSGNTPLTPVTDLSLVNMTTGEKAKYIYVIFDYNVDALETIYNHFLGESFLEEDLYFQCDWTMIV